MDGGTQGKLRAVEIRFVAEQVRRLEEEKEIRMFEVRPMEEPEEKRIEEFRRKIHEIYDGTALGTTVPKDPPGRGPFGEAFIPLVP